MSLQGSQDSCRQQYLPRFMESVKLEPARMCLRIDRFGSEQARECASLRTRLPSMRRLPARDSQSPRMIQKIDPHWGSIIYTIGILESRIGVSIFWILPRLLVVGLLHDLIHINAILPDTLGFWYIGACRMYAFSSISKGRDCCNLQWQFGEEGQSQRDEVHQDLGYKVKHPA